jgi:hypothetical protein
MLSEEKNRGGIMKKIFQIWGPVIFLACACIMGCDSGKEAVDDVTGNKSVKQFQKSKKDIDKAVQKESERFKDINEDETGENNPEDTGDDK